MSRRLGICDWEKEKEEEEEEDWEYDGGDLIDYLRI